MGFKGPACRLDAHRHEGRNPLLVGLDIPPAAEAANGTMRAAARTSSHKGFRFMSISVAKLRPARKAYVPPATGQQCLVRDRTRRLPATTVPSIGRRGESVLCGKLFRDRGVKNVSAGRQLSYGVPQVRRKPTKTPSGASDRGARNPSRSATPSVHAILEGSYRIRRSMLCSARLDWISYRLWPFH